MTGPHRSSWLGAWLAAILAWIGCGAAFLVSTRSGDFADAREVVALPGNREPAERRESAPSVRAAGLDDLADRVAALEAELLTLAARPAVERVPVQAALPPPSAEERGWVSGQEVASLMALIRREIEAERTERERAAAEAAEIAKVRERARGVLPEGDPRVDALFELLMGVQAELREIQSAYLVEGERPSGDAHGEWEAAWEGVVGRWGHRLEVFGWSQNGVRNVIRGLYPNGPVPHSFSR